MLERMTDGFKSWHCFNNNTFFFCKVSKLALMYEAWRQLAYRDSGSASADKYAQEHIHQLGLKSKHKPNPC